MRNRTRGELPVSCWLLVLVSAAVTGCRSTGVRSAAPDPGVVSWRSTEPVPAFEIGRPALIQTEKPATVAPVERSRPTTLPVRPAPTEIQQVDATDGPQSVAATRDDNTAASRVPKVRNQWRSVQGSNTTYEPDLDDAERNQPSGRRIPSVPNLEPAPRATSTRNFQSGDLSNHRSPWDDGQGSVAVPAQATEVAGPSLAVEDTPPQNAPAVQAHRHDHEHHHIHAQYDATPRELAKVSLGAYVIEPPDILLIEALGCLPEQTVGGEHLVRPDGSVGLGIYGSVHVAGLTLDQAKAAIERNLGERVKNPRVNVDVLAYNSKVYYVITDGGGYGEQVFRLPVTGSETVLDAISQIAGLPRVASKRHIWIARPAADGSDQPQILAINWVDITTCAGTQSNYQILPGDRIYVQADKWITFDSVVAKITSPFERMLGLTLLGNSTVRSVQFGHRGLNQQGVP